MTHYALCSMCCAVDHHTRACSRLLVNQRALAVVFQKGVARLEKLVARIYNYVFDARCPLASHEPDCALPALCGHDARNASRQFGRAPSHPAPSICSSEWWSLHHQRHQQQLHRIRTRIALLPPVHCQHCLPRSLPPNPRRL